MVGVNALVLGMSVRAAAQAPCEPLVEVCANQCLCPETGFCPLLCPGDVCPCPGGQCPCPPGPSCFDACPNAAGECPDPNPAVGGRWDCVVGFDGLEVEHMVLLKNGKVMGIDTDPLMPCILFDPDTNSVSNQFESLWSIPTVAIAWR